MGLGNIIGYEINDKFCQISFYNEKLPEPETLKVDADNSEIPLVIGKLRDTWAYGREAKRLVSIKEGFTTARLLEKSLAGEKIEFGEEVYDALQLLFRFIQMSLMSFGRIDGIMFCVPHLNAGLARMLQGVAEILDIDKKRIHTQDYEESFCNYLFYQPKELWQYESVLFSCDRNEIKAYLMRKLKAPAEREKQPFFTVDEGRSAHMKELAAVYPVLNKEKAKEADIEFRNFIRSVFDKRTVSSVFLTGEGFENNWYPSSLRVLCAGRRVFIGNNLYSKGACYTAYRRAYVSLKGPIYLAKGLLTDQISVNMRVNGKEMWYPIVPWGAKWYESDGQWEVLQKNADDIQFHVESLAKGMVKTETISLKKFPKRAEYTVRLLLKVAFLDERTCRVTVEDLGFGGFFPATDFKEEKIIHLGGNDGYFNSLS